MEQHYLSVGTEVSAKYRGAFCEAKIKSVKKNVIFRVGDFICYWKSCIFLELNSSNPACTKFCYLLFKMTATSLAAESKLPDGVSVGSP